MLRALVQLPKTVANFVPQKVTAVLQVESLNQTFYSFNSSDCSQTEKCINAIGDRLCYILQGRSILWRLVMVNDHHFLEMLLFVISYFYNSL